MPGKGLSADEKKVKLLEIFHETKDFYQLKELEKLAPKMKGIVQQSVKDVLQVLLDDGLVRSDKVGSSNFFWSFPSQHGVEAKTRLEKVQRETADLQQKLSIVKSEMEDQLKQRPVTNERKASERRLSEALREITTMERDASAYDACDPVVVDLKRRATLLAQEGTSRWTDNYSSLLGYVRGMDPSFDVRELQQMLQIGDDYEDI